jgi:hypothetical protein
MASTEDRVYTEADRDRVCKLWLQGITVVGIAEAMGTNKNQMSGLLSRMIARGRIQRRGSPVTKRELYGPPKPPPVRVARSGSGVLVAAKAVAVAPQPVAQAVLPMRLPEPARITTRYSHCQFIKSKDRPWKFCDNPAVVKVAFNGAVVSDAWCNKCYNRVYSTRYAA